MIEYHMPKKKLRPAHLRRHRQPRPPGDTCGACRRDHRAHCVVLEGLLSSCEKCHQSLCNHLGSLDSEPVSVLRKMLNLRVAKLFCVLGRDKGIFIAPQDECGNMSGQLA